MQPHSRRGKKWRRFSHKDGVLVSVGAAVAAIVALVGVLKYMLSSMKWRVRY
jgi:hypothetical protein